MRTRIKSLILLPMLALLTAAGGADRAHAAVGGQYRVYDLGSNAVPVSINGYRQIVGSGHRPPSTNQFGLFWSGIISNNTASPTVLAAPVGATRFVAAQINHSGEICGALESPTPGYALSWSHPVSEPRSLGSVSVQADGISAYGQIVGQFRTQSVPPQTHAAYWTNRQSPPVDLGTLGGSDSRAVSINYSGQIAGSSDLPDGRVHATFWPSSSDAPIDLGTLGGSNSAVLCIDDAGAMVGYANTAAQTGASYAAAYWTNASSPALDLGTLGGTNTVALGISPRIWAHGDTIVGFCISNGIARALRWTNASSPPVDLNQQIPTNSGWVLEKATAVNGYGAIVGVGKLNGQDHGFLLTGETTTFTTSTRTMETNLTSTVNQQATNYSTELVAVTPGGTILYDRTFNAAFSDLAVQAAVAQAAGALTDAGATSYIGPTQTSSLQSLTGSSSITVTNPIGTNDSVATTTCFGPQTIMVGPNQSIPFYVVPGGMDLDTLVTSVVTNLVVTTNTATYLISAVYVMTGVWGPEFRITSIRPIGAGQIELQWGCPTNGVYTIERSTNLVASSFVSLATVNALAGPNTNTDTIGSAPLAFYRLGQGALTNQTARAVSASTTAAAATTR